jgi:UDP-N-acetylglucosamine transferase subunit ALG13
VTADPAAAPLVFVTVGTDHHRFDRLMDWMEQWLAVAGADRSRRPDRAGRGVRCVVQHGTARPPAGAECHEFLPHDRMTALFAEAAAVVCQGGPGSITESRQSGRLPIVVPRIPGLREVVDDHQVRFSRHLAALGKIALAESPDALHAHLDRALAEPAAYAVHDGAHAAAPVVARFGQLVEDLVGAPRERRRFRRRSYQPDGSR